MRATATDQGLEHNMVGIDLEVLVVDSRKKAPSFKSGGNAVIQLKENYHDFSVPIVNLTAEYEYHILLIYYLLMYILLHK